MRPERPGEIAMGVALQAVAGVVAAITFVNHERLYAWGLPVIAVVASSFLLAQGAIWSLIFVGWRRSS